MGRRGSGRRRVSTSRRVSRCSTSFTPRSTWPRQGRPCMARRPPRRPSGVIEVESACWPTAGRDCSITLAPRRSRVGSPPASVRRDDRLFRQANGSGRLFWATPHRPVDRQRGVEDLAKRMGRRPKVAGRGWCIEHLDRMATLIASVETTEWAGLWPRLAARSPDSKALPSVLDPNGHSGHRGRRLG